MLLSFLLCTFVHPAYFRESFENMKQMFWSGRAEIGNDFVMVDYPLEGVVQAISDRHSKCDWVAALRANERKLVCDFADDLQYLYATVRIEDSRLYLITLNIVADVLSNPDRVIYEMPTVADMAEIPLPAIIDTERAEQDVARLLQHRFVSGLSGAMQRNIDYVERLHETMHLVRLCRQHASRSYGPVVMEGIEYGLQLLGRFMKIALPIDIKIITS